MIQPIGAQNLNFKADNRTIDSSTGQYKDPLMNWPLRGAAFTNEVGEALRPVIGGAANLTWAPALLYIGADVYDKYKNDKTEYSPDSRRCFKQALFQGLASVGLPVFAVKIGQNIISQTGKFTQNKISLNAKERVSEVAENFIANGKMNAFEGKDDECIKEFLAQVSDRFDYDNKKKSLKNTFKFFRLDSKENVKNYSESTIKDLIEMRKSLIKPSDEFKAGDWYSKYIKALNSGQTDNVAIKTVLTNFQKGKMLQGKFIKTIGGFTALGLSINPIDHFVENVLIKKYVGPQIDNFHKKNNT